MANYRLRIGHSTNHSMPADSGSYTLSGQAASLTYQTSSSYIWYPPLNTTSVPFTSTGTWGTAYAISPAAAPNPSTSVNVSTFAALETACLAGARTITLTGDIDGNRQTITGNIVDVDIVVPPGRNLLNVSFGGGTNTIQRFRIRGNTVGQHSGGRTHDLRFYGGQIFDILFDGIDMTGPGLIGGFQTSAYLIQLAPTSNKQTDARRLGQQYCRIMAGCEGYIGDMGDNIICGNSVYTGALPDPVGQGREAWGYRLMFCPGGNIFYHNDIRGTRYSKIRAHPDGTNGYLWIDSNYMVDLVEAKGVWNDAEAADQTGDLRGFWADNNEVWFDSPGGAQWDSQDAVYVSYVNNIFHAASSVISSPSQLTTGEATTVVKSGNQFLPPAPSSGPAWKSTTPGDPTGLDWNI